MTSGTINPTPLDACSCCNATPCNCPPASPPVLNRPGLPAIAFRAGTHSSFLARMVAALSTFEVTDEDGTRHRPLARLTERAPDDPSIALLDAFAVVGDVLTFYQERIANEGYLRTATERRSVLELARTIGYELNPGVAASTYLAFIVEDAPSAPKQAQVPAGTKVQSVPGPGEVPQTFETSAAMVAHVEWNALKPRLMQPQLLVIDQAEKKEKDESSPPTLYWTQEPIGKANQTRWVAHQIFLAGTGLNFKPADLLLVIAGGKLITLHVVAAADDLPNARTRVDLIAGIVPDVPIVSLPPVPDAAVTQDPVAQTLAEVEARIIDEQWEDLDLRAFLTAQKWDIPTLCTQVASLLAERQLDSARVYSFKQRLSFFGATAPLWESLKRDPNHLGIAPPGFLNSWDSPAISIWRDGVNCALYSDSTPVDVFLEREVPELLADTWVVFRVPGEPLARKKDQHLAKAEQSTGGGDLPDDEYLPYRVRRVTQGTRADFSQSGKATGLKLAEPSGVAAKDDSSAPDGVKLDDPLPDADKHGWFALRKSLAFVQAQPQALAMLPYDQPIQASATTPAQEVMLGQLVIGLAVGQPVMVTGVEAGDAQTPSTGVTRNEVALIDRITHAHGYTTLHFKERLAYRYLRDTFSINANVAPATHGETVAREVLGAGDGSQKNQRFALRKAPLTYVPATTPSGAASTLKVWVNGVAWTEVPYLFGQGPRSQSYTVRIADDGTSSVVFGDGLEGARLPSGQENVTATYRTGIGPVGEVGAGKLSLLINKPLGIRGVVNPLAATGADSPEALAAARSNAPRTVLTLDRVVSLDDFEDFARAFAGVGKAQAQVMWSGQVRVVHLTLAGPKGELIDPDSTVATNLLASIAQYSDGTDEVHVSSYQPLVFRMQAGVSVDPAYDSALVLPAVDAALRAAFCFAARELAQPVTEAEVMTVIQSVPGVIYTNIQYLYLGNNPGSAPNGVLPSSPAAFNAQKLADGLEPFDGAQLLTVSSTGIKLTEI